MKNLTYRDGLLFGKRELEKLQGTALVNRGTEAVEAALNAEMVRYTLAAVAEGGEMGATSAEMPSKEKSPDSPKANK